MMPSLPVKSFRLLSPSLVAVAALWATAGSLSAATVEERDQHFVAVQGLIERGIRPSAERQKAAFVAAAYPDMVLYQKALDWFYADRFRASITDAKIAAALAKEVPLLRKDLLDAENAGKLSPILTAFINGAGDPARRLINELNQFMEPEAVKPLIAPAPERTAQAKRQIDALLETVEASWAKHLRRIAANKKAEETVWDLDEKSPQFQKIAMEAVGARADAVRAVANAHLVLREVITRGATWGLDPVPVKAWFTKFLTANSKAIADWEYNWGDFQPDLKAYANVLLLEAVRQKVPGVVQADIETELVKVLDLDLKAYGDRDVREGVLELQLKSWNALVKSRTELGTSEDLAKGLAYWESFRERSRSLNDMKPACRVPGRAMVLGQLWLSAGRLLEAKGDKAAAAALFGEVAGAAKYQPQMLVQAATSRLRGGDAGPATTGNDWGRPVAAQDPNQALSVARVLLKESGNTADAALARRQLLQAATILRSGILGLEDGDEALFLENGPDLYNLYASVFSRLDMRWHAALAAEEGLSAVAARIPAKGPNPWKKGDAWSDQGKKATVLAKNTLALASQLYSRAKGPGVQRLYDDAIELVKRVAPDLAGENLEWNQITFRFGEADYAGCIDAAVAYAKKYPEQEVKVFGLVSSARMSLIDEYKKKKDEAGARKVADAMIADSAAMAKKAVEALAKPGLDEAKAKEWRKAQTTAESSSISLLMADEKYAEVKAKLGPDYWKNPPADESLRARMLRTLVSATYRQEMARVKDENAKNDPKALIAAWPTFDQAYQTWKRLTPGIKDPEERTRTEGSARLLGVLFQWSSSAADNFRSRPGAPDGLGEIARNAKRLMADCIEPGLTAQDKPRTILAIAQTLWEIDEHERAIRLYELFRSATANDAAASAFRTDPRPALEAVEAQVGSRPELKGDWTKIRDLVEDKPGLADLIKQGVPKEQWGEVKADYSAALAGLRDFRPKVDTLKAKLGDIYPKAVEALKTLEAGIQSQVEDLAVRSRLATGYRELGRKDQARALFQELYAYDPSNGTYASAIVDITLDEIKAGKTQGKEIDTALDIAKSIRNDAGKDRDLYWQASIQSFELSIAKNDAAYVNKTVRFLSVDHSDPSHDLVLPMVLGDSAQAGDDKRIRRARNALSVELARRYLALFAAPGVTEKAPFAIQELPGEKTLTIFVPIDAPRFTLVTLPNADEVDTTIVVEEGKTGVAEKKPAAPAAKPAETPAATPAK